MFTTRPTLQGTFAMVSSTHWLASQSAMAVLERGGNAYSRRHRRRALVGGPALRGRQGPAHRRPVRGGEPPGNAGLRGGALSASRDVGGA